MTKADNLPVAVTDNPSFNLDNQNHYLITQK